MDSRVVVCAAAAALWLTPAVAGAQTFETIGIRAQGMGGAFVAVADDATASWWNPAGLASGALFSGVWERGTTTDPGEQVGAGPGWEGDSNSIALAFPALALSYYRLRVSDIHPVSPAGIGAPGLQDVVLRTTRLSQYGVTAGQSVGNHLVIASTVKLVRAGRVAVASVVSTDAADNESLESAAQLDTTSETSPGLDMGAMVRMGFARVGLTVRNLREPEFGEGDDQFVLERHARAGLALTSGKFGPFDSVSASADTDLTAMDTVAGEARHVAAGAEAWLFSRRIGVRGGFNRNLVGTERSAKSAGLSLGLRTGLNLDGYLTFGSAEARKAWGVGGSVTF